MLTFGVALNSVGGKKTTNEQKAFQQEEAMDTFIMLRIDLAIHRVI